MRIVPKGRLRFNNMRGTFPYQEQPAVSYPDLMANLSYGNTQEMEAFQVDLLSGCAHTQPVFVPHNNRVQSYNGPGTAPTVLDSDSYLGTGLPDVNWDLVLTGPTKAFCSQSNPYGNQMVEVVWDGTDLPDTCYFQADAVCAVQAFSLRMGRALHGSIAVGGSSYYDLRFTAGFQRFSVLVKNNEYAQVRVNIAPLDEFGVPDETEWQVVNPKLRLGTNAAAAMGEATANSGELNLDVQYLGGVLSLSFGAQTSPYKVPFDPNKPKGPITLNPSTPGSLPAGSYTFAYSYVDENGNESELSDFKSAEISAPGTIGVQISEVPSAVATVYVYVQSAATGTYRRFAELENGPGGVVSTTLSGVPPVDAEEPAEFTKPLIQALGVRGEFFTHFSFQAHLGKWKTDGMMVSNPVSLGFSPDPSTPPYYTLCGLTTAVLRDSTEAWEVAWPEGSLMRATTLTTPTSPDVTYQLDLHNETAGQYAGEDYADLTLVCTRVNVNVEGIKTTQVTRSRAVIPKSIIERYSFDPNSLTLQHSLEVVCDNFKGQYGGQSGNTAVKLWLGYHQPSGWGVSRNGGPDATGLWPRFTGFAEDYQFDVPSANRATMSFSAQDQSRILADVPLPSPPIFDGWNHYSAIAFLAQYAGISASQMAFANLVPVAGGGTLASDPNGLIDPYSSAPGDTEPYFLPIGTGFKPYFPRNRTEPVLSLMDNIRKPTGFLLYFDNQGKLQYHKWIPFGPGTVYRTFTVNATGSDGANLSEFWDFSFRSSTRNVRNRVLLIGIDPFKDYYSVLISKAEDAASIESEPGEEPFNYKGYAHPFIWVDPRFADSDFVARAAESLLEMLRIPLYEVSFTCWMQPDIFPMDVVYVNEYKTGILNVPLYVMEVVNHWSYSGDGRQQCITRITGRFLV